MKNKKVVEKIVAALSRRFSDFKGLYFFGSRKEDKATYESDYDVILLFDEINHEKSLSIAGVIAHIEYEEDTFIDYKIFTSSGNRSIEHIRSKINPYFINLAIDNGSFFSRQ